MPGQTAFQTISMVPGVNFTNNDPYGSSGGTIRIHGLDATRLSVTLDGVQLNSAPSNQVFSSDLIDPELIEQINVNLGSTDIDSATPNAVAGTINIVTARPAKTAGIMIQPSVGSFDQWRVFGRIDTGEIGELGTRAFIAASRQKYDKFRGAGDMDRLELNARVFQPLAGGDFISLSGRYLRSRNYFYRALSLSDYTTLGPRTDYSETYTAPTTRTGVADVDPAANGNYYGFGLNPSDTGTLRGQARFTLAPNLLLTIDPSYAFTRGAGGSTRLIAENDSRLRGASAQAGVDLNGDGDLLDMVRVYTTSYAATERYSVTSSLIYDVNDSQRVRIAYTGDFNTALQRSPTTYIRDGKPLSPYGGVPGRAPAIRTADGADLRTRDRYSTADLNQISGEYRGTFLAERLDVTLGLRAPFFSRSFRQDCYSAIGTAELCTTQTDGLSAYLAPYRREIRYHRLLPNAGLSFKPDEHNQIFASYSTGFSPAAPSTLYIVAKTMPPITPGATLGEDYFSAIRPERSEAFNLGYRYKSRSILGSATLWRTDFKDRIVSAFDPSTNLNVSRNMGDVRLWGVDAELGFELVKDLHLYAAASYARSRVLSDIQTGAATFLPTRGKEAVDLPRWTLSGRAEYRIGNLSAGLQAKYVGRRWSTDVNDQAAPAYAIADLDLRYDLDLFGEGRSFVQLNVQNLFDANYLATINSARTAANTPTYYVGAPRTIILALRIAY